MRHVRAQFPEKALPLTRAAPYKVLHGGRGGAKSWAIARILLLLGAKRKLFILCTREIQKSIKESVHKLLSEQIIAMGLQAEYHVQESKIIGYNGTEFVFAGVRNNIASIKSMEGIDIVWVEEATNVTDNSWTVLLPTVRRDAPHGPFGQGSEVWISFNPELDDDTTYKRWVLDPPEGTVVIEMSWAENPWFPDILDRQRLEMKRKDPDSYLTVWEGKTRKALEGAIYAKEITAAVLERRIGPHVKHDRAKGVIVTFDLGKSDMCALWFWQQIGMEHNAIDFYENCGYGIDHYLEEIQRRHYIVRGIWLPHDGAYETQAAPKSIKRQCMDAFPTPGIVRVGPRVGHPTRISLTRALFSRININEVACSGGLLSLRHYQFGVDPETKKRSTTPLHNWASHAASSFSEYALMLKEGAAREKKTVVTAARGVLANNGAQGWMG